MDIGPPYFQAHSIFLNLSIPYFVDISPRLPNRFLKGGSVNSLTSHELTSTNHSHEPMTLNAPNVPLLRSSKAVQGVTVEDLPKFGWMRFIPWLSRDLDGLIDINSP